MVSNSCMNGTALCEITNLDKGISVATRLWGSYLVLSFKFSSCTVVVVVVEVVIIRQTSSSGYWHVHTPRKMSNDISSSLTIDKVRQAKNKPALQNWQVGVASYLQSASWSEALLNSHSDSEYFVDPQGVIHVYSLSHPHKYALTKILAY